MLVSHKISSIFQIGLWHEKKESQNWLDLRDLNALKTCNHFNLKLDYLVVRFSREFSNPSIILLSHNDEVTFIKEIENRAHHHQYFLVVSFLSCQQSIKTSTNKRKRLFTEKKKCENKTVATHANNCFCDLKIT